MALKISVELSHIISVEEIPKHAALIESLGLYRVWIPDTVVSKWEAWIAACTIVHQTKRTQVGLGVTNPYTRHPVVVAQMAATLQHLSNGRFAMSIGKGIGPFLNKAGIVPHDSAVEEYITALRLMIAGQRTSIDGNVFHIDGILLRTLPPEKPVPFYAAAVGPNGWRTAVQVADGVSTFWNETAVKNRQQVMTDFTLPTAGLIPFSVSPGSFVGNTVGSIEELRTQIGMMSAADFDEAIVAYRDIKDLEILKQIF